MSEILQHLDHRQIYSTQELGVWWEDLEKHYYTYDEPGRKRRFDNDDPWNDMHTHIYGFDANASINGFFVFTLLNNNIVGHCRTIPLMEATTKTSYHDLPFSEGEKNHIWIIAGIGVGSHVQHRRIGTTLLNDTLEKINAKDPQAIVVAGINVNNAESIGLFEKCGFSLFQAITNENISVYKRDLNAGDLSIIS